MSLSALSLISGLFWVELTSKQALVCPIQYFDDCLQQLSLDTRAQLSGIHEQLVHDMSGRSVMVLPLKDERVAGLVLTAPEHQLYTQVLHLNTEIFEFTLYEQEELSLWHEMGHLEAQDLANSVFERPLTPFEHEWIADCFVIWKVAHHKPNFTLAWQQYHRRNIDVMSHMASLSHWTVPVLWTVLKEFDLQSLRSFIHFKDFLQAYLDLRALPSKNDLFELSGLLQQTFAVKTSTSLPHYLYWRKTELTRYLRPTLEALMGEDKASDWINSSNLYLKNGEKTRK
ncbi:hypothetical protein [uncultured Shewanella sp.]|uniref:hypothetical protein n=1 Tax=uncultured Shewanella sp. TaxID=173975 RepID=UPI00262E3073|nr:hypothetical protein [uncultured Shewanella sp.]